VAVFSDLRQIIPGVRRTRQSDFGNPEPGEGQEVADCDHDALPLWSPSLEKGAGRFDAKAKRLVRLDLLVDFPARKMRSQ
jgi:hypothetical protein